MRCLDDDIVLGLVEGRLAAPVLADVDVHLDGCATCRDVVAQVARVQAPSCALERGRTVGRYVIGELLGSGAMGRVYSAWEPELDRRVAIKVLVDGARDRMVREAQAMARLDHPNVVGVHEVGTSDEGVYVAMELVEGETLRVWGASTSRRTWRDVTPILIELARGLAAVHAAGVIHRDVKPDNVIVGTDGRARIGDFGLARAGATTTAAQATETPLAAGTPITAVAGTPTYMAPEVLRGGAADAASDQFSFGVTAYELLVGKRPFSGRTWAELLSAIEAGTVATIRSAPGWLDEAIHRCLAAEPARRFASMRELADHLTARAHRRSPTRWVAGAAVAAVLASGATWLAIRRAPSASCEIGAAGVATAWNPDMHGPLAQLGPAALASLDAWATQWSAERDATCQAAGFEPAPKIAARSRCLEQRRAELGALVDRLSHAPALRLGDRVGDALAELPAPSECRISDPGAADPLPLDPARVAIVREVEAGLPALRAAIALGDARPILPAATKLVERARASGYAPTLAEALLVDADALRAAGQLGEATIAARDALAAAERGHDDLGAARAWITRVATAGDRRELAVAEDLGAVAAAAIDRAGAPPRLVATLLRLRGLVAYNRGLLGEATTLLAEARIEFATISGERSIDVANTVSALGSVARAAGDLDAAERHHRLAFELDRALRGEQHPDVARDLHNIAGVLRLRGKLEEAVASYRAALWLENKARGETSVESALTHNSLGLVLLSREDWQAARSELTIARDLLTAAGHGDRAFAHHNLGLLEAAVGNHRLALTHLDRAAAIYPETIGDHAPAAIRLLLDRAHSEIELGAVANARADAAAARLAATAAGIRWIVEGAEVIVQRRFITGQDKRAVPPPTMVEVTIEPAPRGMRPPTQPAAAAMPPVPAPRQVEPKRDVGVYGSAQSW